MLDVVLPQRADDVVPMNHLSDAKGRLQPFCHERYLVGLSAVGNGHRQTLECAVRALGNGEVLILVPRLTVEIRRLDGQDLTLWVPSHSDHSRQLLWAIPLPRKHLGMVAHTAGQHPARNAALLLQITLDEGTPDGLGLEVDAEAVLARAVSALLLRASRWFRLIARGTNPSPLSPGASRRVGRIAVEEPDCPKKSGLELACLCMLYELEQPSSLSRLEVVPTASVRSFGCDRERALVAIPQILFC
mmetsp:Transcript_32028/g.62651  ORF Transcript_32028/g.62651 Transcript_32028/m.62651 type:complete len:246 (-) Transcript_32028:145-882(-)